MGRSQETFSKKENEKKRIAKRRDKAEKAEERKTNNDKGKGLDSMMAYVDENGNISDTPPDPKKVRVAISADDIQLGATRIESIDDGAPRQGIVTHFNDEKGYGFIRDLTTQESIFVHISGLDGGPVKEGNKVTFTVEMGQKGPNAVGVKVAP